MKKIVDGISIELTPAEAAAMQAAWNAWAAGEPARLADAQRVAAVDDAIAGDNVLALLKAQTAGEYDAWWAANVTTLAQASTVLKRVVRVLVRRVL